MLTQALLATLELLRPSIGPHTITTTPFLASLSPGLSSMLQGPVAAVLTVSKRLAHAIPTKGSSREEDWSYFYPQIVNVDFETQKPFGRVYIAKQPAELVLGPR